MDLGHSLPSMAADAGGGAALGHDDGASSQRGLALKLLTTGAMLLLYVVVHLSRSAPQREDGLMTANRRFPWEPSLVARLRWSLWAQQTLKDADSKAGKRPYTLARGDKELVVLPPHLIADLNRLGPDVLDSRKSHAFALLGHLTGMQVVEKTSYHVRMLLGRIGPALPQLLAPMSARIAAAMEAGFPRGRDWEALKPLPATVRCFSEGITLALFGARMSEDPSLVRLTYMLTEDVFTIAFTMRCVPAVLQPVAVWLLPAKWRLRRRWRELAAFVEPEVARQKAAMSSGDGTPPASPDLVSWMVRDGRSELERDPGVLTTLCGSVAAGSIYSIANFVCRTLAELAAHPDVLDAVRAEVRARHAQVGAGGRWDAAALAGLDRLESVMKETARLAPGTLLVYSRVVQRACAVQGLALAPGQSLTVSGMARAADPALFPDPDAWHGLRFCAPDRLDEHRARPFRSVDTDILTWGAGRWACPGRQVADMAAKVLLIQLIDGYDFALVGGKPLRPSAIHEFLFFHPDNTMLVRRRADAVGIEFS